MNFGLALAWGYGIAGMLALILWPIIGWITHIGMTKGDSKYKGWGWGGFRQFKKEFEKYEWDDEKWHGNSLWNRENNCEYHASIIRFQGFGMVLRTPIDWILVRIYIKRYFKSKYPRHDWSKV